MPANNLPVQLSSFIGREREIKTVKRLLNAGRVVTLSGAGGCGKTRLALHAAAEILAGYEDGVWFVDLAPLSSPALITYRLASIFNIHEQPMEPLPQTLATYLRDKQMLLLLDNCEHLIEACAQLATSLLQTCPRLTILATSREALNIDGESAWVVPSLALPPASAAQSPLTELEQSDAIRLFVERAAAVVPEFNLTEQNAAAVTQICRQVDGIPLAIELAAARVKVLGIEQIAARLSDAMRLLTEGKRTAAPRQQTLRATLDWSHAMLSPPEQSVFRRLAVFAGGFTLEAAEVICAGEGVPGDDVLNRLTQLLNRSLVLKQEQDGGARYRLLEPIRQYAREQSVAAGEHNGVDRRHLAYFRQLAEEAEPKLIGREQVSWLRRLDAEQDNLRAALAWAREEGAPADGLRLATALRWWWYWRGFWLEAKECFAGLLAHAEAAHETAEPTRLLARAAYLHAFFSQQFAEPADTLFERALRLAKAVDDQETLADVWLWRHMNSHMSGDPLAIRANIEASLALARQSDDRDRTAWALGWRGYRGLLEGDVDAARGDIEEALRLHRASGNQFGIAWCVSTLGLVAHHDGDYAAARALNEESLRLAREIGDKRQVALALQRLGQSLTSEGEYASARATYVQATALRRELGTSSALAHMLNLMSNLMRLTGDEVGARTMGADGLRLARESGERLQEAHALSALGRVALAQGDHAEARAQFEQSLVVRQQIGNRLDMPPSLLDLGDLALLEGEHALASEFYERALAVSREIGTQASVPGALRMLGYIALARGELGQAAQRFTDGLRFYQRRKFRLGLSRQLPAFAALAVARGEAQRAARLLGAADALLEEMQVRLEPVDARSYQETLAVVRARLDEATFAAAWAAGSSLTLEQAVAEAELLTAAPEKIAAEPRDPLALTQRELEVLRMLAQRLTDAEIATRLVISPRTVNTHLTSIYGKLSVNSRRAAAEYALVHKLI